MVLLIKKGFFPNEVCPLYFSEKYRPQKSKQIHCKVKCAHLVPEPSSRWRRHVVPGSKEKNHIENLILVDTVFGHVSLDAYLELMRCRSVGKKVVTSSQKSCRWGLVPMKKRQNMAKSRSSDGSVPMTGADGCWWLWKVVCRWSWRKVQELPIDSWWCTDRLWKMT